MIEVRLREGIEISDNQFGFMPGMLTVEAIYLIRRLMEFYKDRKRDIYMVFIDLEKVYNRGPRGVLWSCLEKKGISVRMYELLKTCMME